jgi:hypothetical protein
MCKAITAFTVYKFLCYNVFVILSNVVYGYLIMSYIYISHGNVVFGEGSQNASNMEYYYKDMFDWSEVYFLVHLIISIMMFLSLILCATVKCLYGDYDRTFKICSVSMILIVLCIQMTFFALAIDIQQYVSVICSGVIEDPESSRPNTFDMCYFYNNYFKIMFNVLAAEVAVNLFHILTFLLYLYIGFIWTKNTGKILNIDSVLDPGSQVSDSRYSDSRYSNSVSRYRSSIDSQFSV